MPNPIMDAISEYKENYAWDKSLLRDRVERIAASEAESEQVDYLDEFTRSQQAKVQSDNLQLELKMEL